MHNRHFPRLCHACQAPLEAQVETCWRCGATPEPQAALRLIEGGAAQVDRQPEVAQVSTAEWLARPIAEARA